MSDMWIFVGALAVAYLVPGPDMILILQTSAAAGRRQGAAVAVGLAAARAAHVLAAAIGLAALLRAAPGLFDAVRIAGAAYLAWIGIGLLRASNLVPAAAGGATGRGRDRWGVAWRRGFLTNLLNPKALLFCSILLPQFVRPDIGAVSSQFVLLGIVLVAVGGFFDLIYVGAGAGLGRFVARHPAVGTAQRFVFAGLLIGFGLRLALAPRTP